MAEHENNVGESDEWYTPLELLGALAETYDLDPCSPGEHHWVPAAKVYTKQDNGLELPWEGFVFMNPPFGKRHGHVPWLKKFLERKGGGIAIVRAYTSSDWFHEWAVKADAMLFPKGKTKFIRPDGSIGRSPGHGIVLLGMGERAKRAMKNSGLGLYIDLAYGRKKKELGICMEIWEMG